MEMLHQVHLRAQEATNQITLGRTLCFVGHMTLLAISAPWVQDWFVMIQCTCMSLMSILIDDIVAMHC